MKKSIKRPQSLSTCLAVAKRAIDSFCKKNIFVVPLRKTTERRAMHYAKQMDCTTEQLMEGLMEYFIYVQMEGTASGQKMHLGEGKQVYIENFIEEQEEKRNTLAQYLG